jgi:hypothetical protein
MKLLCRGFGAVEREWHDAQPLSWLLSLDNGSVSVAVHCFEDI